MRGSPIKLCVRHRQQPLLLCADIVRLEWSDDRGVACRSAAILEEIQPSRALLLLDHDSPPNRKIPITLLPGGYRGKARRCITSPSGYHLEITFDKGVRWHPADYQPSHAYKLTVAS